MQTVTFKNTKNLQLTATLWTAPSKSIIVMAHGWTENRFARGVFTAIAERLQELNYNVLSFDLSGHGQSEDELITVESAANDMSAAITFVKEQGYQHIALLGHSLGSLACLKAYLPEIETMILLGALTGPMKSKFDETFSEQEVQSVSATGYIVSKVNDGFRQVVKTDANILNTIKAINQQELLSRITSPILIIHGNGDQAERNFLALSQQGFCYLPDTQSEIKVIEGADHLFIDATDTVVHITAEWLRVHFNYHNVAHLGDARAEEL